MSGLTIYETLRIFVPGAVAILILDVSVRIATGATLLSPEEGFAADVVTAIESTATFAVLALVVGLILYLVDLPNRMRLMRGDPTQGITRPSERFGELVREANSGVSAMGRTPYPRELELSLSFVFLDKYLPADLHKRIYLFGSLYRIFVDVRIMLICAIGIGVPTALANATRETGQASLPFDGTALAAVLMVTAVIGLIGLQGAGQAARRTRKAVPGSDGENVVEPAKLAWTDVIAPAGVLATGAVVATLVALKGPDSHGYWGTVVGIAACALWFGLECGPPGDNPEKWTFRDKCISTVNVRADARPQLPVWFRTVTDLALIVPSLVGATMLNATLGRPPLGALVWGVLAIPAVLIMTVRKHEHRLLSVYQHQNAFLAVSERAIVDALRAQRGLPGDLA